MKVLPFFSLILTLALCTIGCSDQIAEEQFEAAPSFTEATFSAKKSAPPAVITTVTPQCGKLGATALLYITSTNHHSVINIDVYSEDGFFIDRWTRQNPTLSSSITINLGTPPNGSKDCSLLDGGTTYRLALGYGTSNNNPEPNAGDPWTNGIWPNPFSSTGEDTLVTISPCLC